MSMVDLLVASVALRASRAPVWLLEGVRTGIIPEGAVGVWADVSHRLRKHFDETAASVYWKNEAEAQGLQVPKKYGVAETGKWEVGDDLVSAWERQTARTRTMAEGVMKLFRSWRKGLDDLERDLGLTGIDFPIETLEALDSLARTLDVYYGHTTPVAEFEEEFQFSLVLVKKRLDERKILETALTVGGGSQESDATSKALKDLKKWASGLAADVRRCKSVLAGT